MHFHFGQTVWLTWGGGRASGIVIAIVPAGSVNMVTVETLEYGPITVVEQALSLAE